MKCPKCKTDTYTLTKTGLKALMGLGYKDVTDKDIEKHLSKPKRCSNCGWFLN